MSNAPTVPASTVAWEHRNGELNSGSKEAYVNVNRLKQTVSLRKTYMAKEVYLADEIYIPHPPCRIQIV